MNRRTKIWLPALLLICAGGAAPPLVDWTAIKREPPCSGAITVFVGIYPASSAAGRRASLQRLSEEIRRCPQCNEFRVRRDEDWFAFDDFDKDETLYDRRQRVLYEGNVWAGDSYRWGDVTDQEIEAVARSSGNFEDFARFGCKDMKPVAANCGITTRSSRRTPRSSSLRVRRRKPLVMPRVTGENKSCSG